MVYNILHFSGIEKTIYVLEIRTLDTTFIISIHPKKSMRPHEAHLYTANYLIDTSNWSLDTYFDC